MWAVGFLEGEGTFNFNKTMVIQAVQVTPEPLFLLLKMFGGSIKNYSYPSQFNAQPYYMWYVGGARAAGVAMTLFYLFSEKRQIQISDALSKWKAQPSRPGGAYQMKSQKWRKV